MKVFKIVMGILLSLLLVVIVVLVVLVKTVDVNRFKDQLTTALRQQLKTEVVIENLKLNVSLSGGITAQAQGVDIKDFPGFSSESLFRVDRAGLNLDVLALLTKGKVVVNSILIEHPQIKIIRNKKGELNLQQFAGPVPADSSAGQSTAGESVSPQNLPLFLVKDITVRQGRMIFVDESQTTPLTIVLDQITLKIRNCSLDQPFDLFAQAALFAAKENVQFSSRARVDLQTAQFRIDDAQFSVDMGLLAIDQLERAAPAVQQAGLNDLQGKVVLKISQLVVGKEGLQLLAGKGEADIPRLSTKHLAVPVEAIMAHFTISERDIDIQDFSLRLGTGTVSGKARLDEYLKRQKYALTVNADQLDFKQIVPEELNQFQAGGSLRAKVELAGEGFDPARMLSALKGGGEFAIQDGKLENLNVLKLVFSRSPVLAELLQPVIEEKLPAKYKEILNSKGTAFGKILCSFKADKGVVTVDQADMDADIFALSASGSLDQQMNVSAQETLALVKDISDQMVAGAPELSALLDQSGRVSIPMKRYEGPLAGFKIMPDAEVIAKQVIMNRGKQELEKLFEKVLPKSQGSDSSSPEAPTGNDPSGPDGQTQPQEKNPEEQILDNVLDSIFK